MGGGGTEGLEVKPCPVLTTVSTTSVTWTDLRSNPRASQCQDGPLIATGVPTSYFEYVGPDRGDRKIILCGVNTALYVDVTGLPVHFPPHTVN